jgi:hypothetical protein
MKIIPALQLLFFTKVPQKSNLPECPSTETKNLGNGIH